MTKHEDTSDSDSKDLSRHGISAAAGVAIGTVLIPLIGPLGPVIGAAASPPIDEAVRRCLQILGDRVAARPSHVIQTAAERAGITVPELSQRLLAVPGGEDLLLKTIRAATDVAQDEKLIALSQSLASAVSESSPITFESQLVGVIGDLDESHFVVLDYLLTSANDLGFSKSELTDPVKTLNMVQLKMFAPQHIVELAEPIFAGLERHGLVNGLVFTGGIGGGARSPDHWEITTFGEAVVERMRTIGAFLRPR
jgi:hypothetical protein